jgi:Helix-turn-helix.
MLTGREIRAFRELRGLSLRQVAKFCTVSPQFIGQVETEQKPLAYDTYKDIISAINKATVERDNGTI